MPHRDSTGGPLTFRRATAIPQNNPPETSGIIYRGFYIAHLRKNSNHRCHSFEQKPTQLGVAIARGLSGTYYYLVESYRDGGKMRQRTVAYLDEYPSVHEALAGLPEDIEHACRQAGKWWGSAEEQRRVYLDGPAETEMPPGIPKRASGSL